MGKNIVFFDFDHTLFDTDRFFHVDLRNELSQLGVDMAVWDACYPRVCARGYTLQNHANEMCLRMDKLFPSADVDDLIAKRFSKLNKYLFPDTEPYLAYLKSHRYLLAILSFGNPNWQQFKLRASGIDCWFDHCFFTQAENKKIDAVRSMAKDYDRIFVIDNHPGELDAIKDAMPEVETIHIDRVPSDETLKALPARSFFEARKYRAMVSRHEHCELVALDDIIGL
jgi:phosphoglycolate phosphatase-like HAD superfamily hydrolase